MSRKLDVKLHPAVNKTSSERVVKPLIINLGRLRHQKRCIQATMNNTRTEKKRTLSEQPRVWSILSMKGSLRIKMVEKKSGLGLLVAIIGRLLF